MAKRRPRLTEEQWLQHKPFIRQRFLVENKPLKDLQAELQKQGLQVTKAQLEYKLKQWKMAKNIDGATWRSIDHVITKRKLQGKYSEVIHCGKRLKQSTVDKETRRHQFCYAVASPPPLSSESTQIVICTPPSLRMEFDWPDTLPWLKFQDISRIWASISSQKHSLQSTIMRQGGISPLDAFTSQIYSGFGRTQVLDTTVHRSRLVAAIGMMMPEFHPGEHLQTVQLLANSGRDSIPGFLRLVIYTMSNAMGPDVYNGFRVDIGAWEATFHLLVKTGLLEVMDDLKTIRQQSLTIRAFMDNLFRATVDYMISCRDPRAYRGIDKARRLAQWLLSLGQKPDVLVPRDGDPADLSTALDKAIRFHRPDVVEFLLKSGTDTSLTLKSPPHETLVHRAMNSSSLHTNAKRTIEVLVRCNACTALDEAHAAIILEDKDLLQKALQRGADLTRAVRVDTRYLIYQQTALSVAAEVSIPAIRQVLVELKNKYPSTPTATFVTPDVFVAAAISRDPEVISYLHEINPIGFMVNKHGITPLQAAVIKGRPLTSERLFQLYAQQTSTTLILCLAIYQFQKGIFRDFLDAGVDVDATTVPGDEKLAAYLGSGLWDVVLDKPRTPLEILLRWPETTEAIESLLDHGAKFPADGIAECAQVMDTTILFKALNAGGSPNARDRLGKTPLYNALTFDPCLDLVVDNIEVLLKSGAELLGAQKLVLEAIVPIHVRIAFPVHPLMDRDPEVHEDLRLLLLDHGAGSMGLDNDAGLDIEAAIFAQNDLLLQEILAGFPGYYHPGALCAAALVGNHWIIDFLLGNRDRQAQPDLVEGTAVGLAAWAGGSNLVRKLVVQLQKPGLALIPFGTFGYETPGKLEAERSNNIFWHEGTRHGSPLALAASERDASGFSELLRMGYRPDRLTWVRVVELGAHGCLQALLDYDQRVGGLVPPPLELRPLLIPAIERNDRGAVISLLKSGADANERNCMLPSSRSPLQHAVELGSIEIVDSLLRANPQANINAPPSFMRGVTALQVAAIKGYLGLAKKLLDLGARVNARGARECGRTALEGAAEHGRLDMIQLLVDHGALTTGLGGLQCARAIYFATRNGHDAAAELLRRSQAKEDADSRLQVPPRCKSCPSFDSKRGYRVVDCHDSDGCLSFCCDEIHGPEDACIGDYTDDEENWYTEMIMRRKFARDDAGNCSVDETEVDKESVDDEDLFSLFTYL